MTRLSHLGLVTALDRRVGGVRAGSSARVWQLTSAGRRLVTTIALAKRPHEPSPRLLVHSLAVADAHLAITRLSATHDTISRAEVAIESGAWRRYTGIGGDRRILQPDLAVTLHGHDNNGDFEDRWFIEVDCGTESIPTLLRKCKQYDDYRASGTEQDAHDVFPRVAWIQSGSRAADRAARLSERIARSGLPEGMFSVGTLSEVAGVIGGTT